MEKRTQCSDFMNTEPLIDLVMNSTPSRMTLLQPSVVSYGRQTTAVFNIYGKLEVGGGLRPHST